MKKVYIKPEITMEFFVPDTMLVTSDNRENMGSSETPGGDDDFNSRTRRGEWGNLWESESRSRW